MGKKFPPRGYKSLEYPLPHNFDFQFDLEAEDETKNSTIVTLFKQSEACNAPESVEVNPTNDNFVEDTGTCLHRGSIVPRVNVTFRMALTKGAVETDKLRQLTVNWMPIYTAFLDNLDASDEKTGTDIEDILELTHATDNKDTFPLFADVNLTNGTNIALTTVGFTEVFGDVGLTNNAIGQSVAFDMEKFYDALQFYTNSGMLGKSIGKMNAITLTRERPFTYHSNNFTNPSVKRANPYTFCGILFHLPLVAQSSQFYTIADTTVIGHVHINGNIRYDEWNSSFQQAAI